MSLYSFSKRNERSIEKEAFKREKEWQEKTKTSCGDYDTFFNQVARERYNALPVNKPRWYNGG